MGCHQEETSIELPDINTEEYDIEQSIMRSLEDSCDKLALGNYETEENDQTEPDDEDVTILDDRISEDADAIEVTATEQAKMVLKQRPITQYFPK